MCWMHVVKWYQYAVNHEPTILSSWTGVVLHQSLCCIFGFFTRPSDCRLTEPLRAQCCHDMLCCKSNCTITITCPQCHLHGIHSIPIVPKSVQSNGCLMCNKHLLIIWIIEEDILIFYDANKAIRSDLEISLKDLWAVDLVIIHKKL